MLSHYVPKFYLKYFVDHGCIAGGRLWVVDFESGRIRRLPAGKAARHPDYYADHNEAFFQRIETDAGRSLPSLVRRKSPKKSDRVAIARLIASLLPRVPFYRKRAEASLRSLDAKAHIIVDCKGRFVEEIQDPDAVSDYWLEFALTDAEPLVNYFTKMNWELLEPANEALFLTSDAPVHCIGGRWLGPPFSESQHPMTRMDAEMSFPVNPKTCMLATWQNERAAGTKASPELTTQMNIRRIARAERYAYAPARELAEWALEWRRHHPECPNYE